MSTTLERTCGSCRHWIPDADAGAIPSGPVLLSDPSKPKSSNGECRLDPPSATVMPVIIEVAGMRQEGVRRMSSYPPVMSTFPACSRFDGESPKEGPVNSSALEQFKERVLAELERVAMSYDKGFSEAARAAIRRLPLTVV
jgi:hypothetical protein